MLLGCGRCVMRRWWWRGGGGWWGGGGRGGRWGRWRGRGGGWRRCGGGGGGGVGGRGGLMEGWRSGGAVVGLGVSEGELESLLVGWGGGVGVAAVNGPSAVVVSGDVDAVAGVVGVVSGWGRRVSPLRVSHA